MTRRAILEEMGATLTEVVAMFMGEGHEDTSIAAFNAWLMEDVDFCTETEVRCSYLGNE